MQVRFPFVLFIAMLLATCFSCQGEQAGNASSTETSADSTAQTGNKAPSSGQARDVSSPDDAAAPSQGESFATDELRVKSYRSMLAGKWFGQADPNRSIEITEEEWRVFQHDKLVSTSSYSIALKCQKAACANAAAPNWAWCISTDAECFLVPRLDYKELHLQKVGDPNRTAYQKSLKDR